ncbi:hypothetical protein [Hallella multisaccharivorax]|uniref:hypothetical protein n=1 Tax=Hallella multisaccharivorax TaxID=310514 RepID=UPI0036240660
MNRLIKVVLVFMLYVSLAVTAMVTAANSLTRQMGSLNVMVTFYAPSVVGVTKTLEGGLAVAKSYSVIHMG